MGNLREKIQQAQEKLQRITRQVCGACMQNCCHQGTMMGSHGLRRLHKGLLMDPSLGARLRAGLRQRQEEIAYELQIAEKVADLLTQAHKDSPQQERLTELQRRLADLRSFVEYMGQDFPLTAEGMSRLLLYTAIRSNLLRSFRQFPGGEAALARLSQGRGSFRFRGRKMSPPRCIFHHEACLAEIWKPVKCANFFCASEPNLLACLQQEMSFDEFVLANIRLSEPAYLLRLIRLENQLGPQYWEPKVIIGPAEKAPAFHQEIIALLREDRSVHVEAEPNRFMRATNEILQELDGLLNQQNIVYTCATIDGVALYELGVALERARSSEWHGGLFVLAQELSPHSFMPHPLWEDATITQPLGGLEIYLLTDAEDDKEGEKRSI